MLTRTPPTPRPNASALLGGVSLLVIVAFLASDPLRGGLPWLTRSNEGAAQTGPIRAMSAGMHRAARALARTQPFAADRRVVGLMRSSRSSGPTGAPGHDGATPRVAMLREGLLNLPPPVG